MGDKIEKNKFKCKENKTNQKNTSIGKFSSSPKLYTSALIF